MSRRGAGGVVSSGQAMCRHALVAMRQLGPRDVLRRMVVRAFRPQPFVLLRADLATYDLTIEPLTPGIAVDIWDRGRLEPWRRGRPDLPLEFFADEMHGVTSCAVAHRDGAPMGLIWIYRAGNFSRFFHLGTRAAELNYGHVLRPYRRHRVFQAVLRRACQHLRDTGYQAAWAAVHAANQPSLAAFRAAGFADAATIQHFLVYRPRLRVAAVNGAGAA